MSGNIDEEFGETVCMITRSNSNTTLNGGIKCCNLLKNVEDIDAQSLCSYQEDTYFDFGCIQRWRSTNSISSKKSVITLSNSNSTLDSDKDCCKVLEKAKDIDAQSLCWYHKDTYFDSRSIQKWRSLNSISSKSSVINEETSECGGGLGKTNSSYSLNSSKSAKSSVSFDSRIETDLPIKYPIELKENICRTVISSKQQKKLFKRNKSFCLQFCLVTWSFSWIFLLGLTLVGVGLLLPFGFWSYRKITTSVKHVEGHVPSYVSGSMMTICGILCVISSLKKHRILILLILVLSLICTVFCSMSLVYLISEVNQRLGQLEECSFNAYHKICSCYVITGERRQLYRFSQVMNCRSVKENLRELVYGVSVLFGLGCFISMVTMISSIYLLCKDKHGNEELVSPDHAVSTTTQTQESSFTSPRDSFSCFGVGIEKQYISHSHETLYPAHRFPHNINNFSVSTQTPAFMMALGDLVFDNPDSRDTTLQFDLLIDGCNEPPPSYRDAVASLKI